MAAITQHGCTDGQKSGATLGLRVAPFHSSELARRFYGAAAGSPEFPLNNVFFRIKRFKFFGHFRHLFPEF